MPIKTMNEFLHLSFEMQHIEPKNQLEAVLKEYSWANSTEVLDIVANNCRILSDAGILEPGFLDAWCRNKYGSPHWPISLCHFMFSIMNRQKLLEAGDPLPSGDIFTIYRGVAGVGSKRRVRGYSWTLDKETARRFCNIRTSLFGLPNPAIFQAVIKRQHVFAYIEGGQEGGEQELLVDPFKLEGIKRVWRESAYKQAA